MSLRHYACRYDNGRGIKAFNGKGVFKPRTIFMTFKFWVGMETRGLYCKPSLQIVHFEQYYFGLISMLSYARKLVNGKLHQFLSLFLESQSGARTMIQDYHEQISTFWILSKFMWMLRIHSDFFPIKY